VHQLDPSRQVTVAMNEKWGEGFSKVIDVQGFNYVKKGNTDAFHDDFPNHPAIGTEDASTVSTRGIYENDATRGYLSAYDVNAPSWGLTAEAWWNYYLARPWAAGCFVWTGFDYRGEPTPYSWPCINSHFGIMDTCGFPKDNFFFYQAWWSEKPVLHILPHWNWSGREGKEISVWVHSNYDSVELLLNGNSLGRREMPRNSHLEWKVPYAPGVLEARGYLGETVSGIEKVETTGAPAKLELASDRVLVDASGEDVAIVTVSATDAKGRRVPIANDHVSFELSGPGRIVGVGNGDPSSHEPDHANERNLFNGLAQVIVKTTKTPGAIRLKATSGTLTAAEVTVTAAKAPPRPSVP
jgi:beta-galactosidase